MTLMTPPAEFTPRRITIHVGRRAHRALRAGAVRIFESDIRDRRGAGRLGDLAIVYSPRDRPIAMGIYDPNSPVRVRILTHTMGATIDAGWMRDRVREIVDGRLAAFEGTQTDGYRLIHGPGDGLPGLVVDRYAQTAVFKVYSGAWFPWLSAIAGALRKATGLSAGLVRLSRHLQHADAMGYPYREGTLLWGDAGDVDRVFLERGMAFEVDPYRGQKTGFFLDQRENRARVEALSDGQSVLNVFCYTGGFSLFAARGGATRVVSVDASRPAMDALARNIARNRDAFGAAKPVFEQHVGDAFEELRALQRDRERFGVVIIDPPSFAKRASEVEAAMAAYRRLARLGLSLLKPGGTLVFASCSSRIDAAQLEDALQQGARDGGTQITIFERSAHPKDHLVRDPNTQYLKCLYARHRADDRRSDWPPSRR